MLNITPTLLLLLTVAVTACAPKSELATQEVSSSRYVGGLSSDGLVEYYLGIPFAKAPVGDLRWVAPQPLEENTANFWSTIKAREFAPACMQGPHLTNWYKDVIQSFGGDPDSFLQPEVSEDCLYLNVWKSKDIDERAEPSKRPVLVFIHGGSNKGGWSYEPNYLGEQLAKRGIIVVTIAYRVGAFGFFAHSELDQVNFGLLDQVAALTWVKENIADFGGDADNVTVAGESAGANNIEYLMASPIAKGLFQRVAHQSGGSVMHDRTSKDVHEALGSTLAGRVLGVDDNGGIKALRKASSKQIINAAHEVYANHYFDPVVDGHSVIEPLSQSIESSTFAEVDLLIGANADEWTVYVEDSETIDSWLNKNLPHLNVAAIKRVLNNGESTTKQLDRLITAHYFVCPSLSLASANSKQDGNSWFYQFSRVRPGALAASMGAYHGAELPYVFGTHDDWLPTNQQDLDVGESVMSYWVNFTKTGNPNGVNANQAALPHWPAYKNDGDLIQNINTEIISQVHSSQKLCEILMPTR